MKFPEYNTAHANTIHIPSLSKGITVGEAFHDCQYESLKEGKNVWLKDGVLKTRPALDTNRAKVIDSGEFSMGRIFNYKVTGIEVEIDDDIKRLVLEEIDYDISCYICQTHFLNSNGTPYMSSAMIFHRLDDDTFNVPYKIHFYKGKPQEGVGIFALVSLINCENYSQKTGRIFELSTDFTQWVRIYSPYIPTVLVNGRGNRYEFAKATNQAFTGTPTRLEGLNILNNTFHAYYSTDGYSSSFRLPLSELSNGSVICRLYYSVGSYVQWIIEANTTSATAKLFDVEITANVNREKGIVFFKCPGGDYSMPLIYDRNENNLRITATKVCNVSMTDVIDADSLITVNNKILLGRKNLIYEASFDNPLYFPIESVGFAGSADSTITAFSVLNDQAIAFKKNEIYSVSVKQGRKLSATSLLADTDAVFYENDTLTVKSVSQSIGCKDMGSVICSNRKIFWLGNDNRIYSLNSAGKITCLSEQLPIDAYTKVFGLEFNGYNLFFNEYSAFVMGTDPKNSDNAYWYFWEFPNEIRIIGAYSIDGGPVLLCTSKYNNICYAATLTGEEDTYLLKISSMPMGVTMPVCSTIRSQSLSLGCDNSLKKIDWIILQLKGDAEISVNDRPEATIKGKTATDFNTVRLNIGLCAVNKVEIALNAQNPIELGSIDIKYTSLKF